MNICFYFGPSIDNILIYCFAETTALNNEGKLVPLLTQAGAIAKLTA